VRDRRHEGSIGAGPTPIILVGFLGLVLAWRAAVVACHGGYECPL
jgi:hypothetical protein